jgi:hypothetical protein
MRLSGDAERLAERARTHPERRQEVLEQHLVRIGRQKPAMVGAPVAETSASSRCGWFLLARGGWRSLTMS